MRIPLFSFDANPKIDRPLCFKSGADAVRLLESARARVLLDDRGVEWGLQFIDLRPVATFAGKLSHALATLPERPPTIEELVPTKSGDSSPCITDEECQANVGIAEDPDDILRAQNKVHAYPHIDDDRNPLARGMWACGVAVVAVAAQRSFRSRKRRLPQKAAHEHQPPSF